MLRSEIEGEQSVEAAIRDPRKASVSTFDPDRRITLGLGDGELWPLQINRPAWTFWLRWILFIIPHGLGIWPHVTFRHHHTTVDPRGRVSQIVTSGPFAHMRNPMYLSLIPLYIGGILAFRLPWAVLLLPIVFVLLQLGVILQEERHLEEQFHNEYRLYKQQVNRCL